MLLRIAVLVLFAMGLVGFGATAWLSAGDVATQAPPPPPPKPKTRILAASWLLRPGTLLKPEDLSYQEVEQAPPDSLLDTSETRAGLVGAMVRRSVAAGEPLTPGDTIRPGDHGFLAAVLGPGMRAATVGVDSISGSAGLIWPGDHVDLILTQSLDGPAVTPGHHIAAETVLADVRVIAIDQTIARGIAPAGDAQGSRTVTLEVTQLQAERIAVATRLGRLSLSVRAADSADPAPATQVQTTWGGDVSPALQHAGQQKEVSALHVYSGTSEQKEFRF